VKLQVVSAIFLPVYFAEIRESVFDKRAKAE